MQSIKEFQDQCIDIAREKFRESPPTQQVVDAFYSTPRHLFIKKYRHVKSKDWLKITVENLVEHLPTLYSDNPLIIYGDDCDFEDVDGKSPVSTISQPSFVLRMIDLLQVQSGHKIFELGSGSGWNAALLGRMVGPQGRVVSVEIIPDLIQNAKVAIQEAGLKNTEIYLGDGCDGYKSHAPYDRAIFTAGAYDLPLSFFHEVKDGGLLLFVLKNAVGVDNLFLLEKKNDHFESIFSMACGFVPVTGKFNTNDGELKSLNLLLKDCGIDSSSIGQHPFWWAGANYNSFEWKTAGLRSFLSITEPMYESIKLDNGRVSFGILNKVTKSLVLARHDSMTSYGCPKAYDQLIAIMKKWVEMGMPALSNFKLKVYPADVRVNESANEWVTRKNSSQFIWSLPA